MLDIFQLSIYNVIWKNFPDLFPGLYYSTPIHFQYNLIKVRIRFISYSLSLSLLSVFNVNAQTRKAVCIGLYESFCNRNTFRIGGAGISCFMGGGFPKTIKGERGGRREYFLFSIFCKINI